jgi:hypothetical protein
MTTQIDWDKLAPMKTIRVTPEMAKRMLEWLILNGIRTYPDTKTVDDLIKAAQKDKE